MEWEVIGPMVAFIVLVLTIGGVVLLRPLASRLGHLLEAMAKEREGDNPRLVNEIRRMHDELERMRGRLELLEERQDFADQILLEGGERTSLRRGEGEEDGLRPKSD